MIAYDFPFFVSEPNPRNLSKDFLNEIIGRKMHNLRLGFQHWVHSQIIINDHKLKTVHQHLFLENLYIQLKFPHAHLGTWFPGSLWGLRLGFHSWTWFPGSLWVWGFTVELGFQGHCGGGGSQLNLVSRVTVVTVKPDNGTWYPGSILLNKEGLEQGPPFSWKRRALNKGWVRHLRNSN